MIKAELVTPSVSNWDTYGLNLMNIEQEVFKDKAFDPEEMQIDINDSGTLLVVLKDNDKIIGFSYATKEDDNTSCIIDTALLPDHQNKRLVSLINNLMTESLKKYNYKFIIRYAMIDNGYADKIEKAYKDKIIEKYDLESKWGKQRFFKIIL